MSEATDYYDTILDPRWNPSPPPPPVWTPPGPNASGYTPMDRNPTPPQTWRGGDYTPEPMALTNQQEALATVQRKTQYRPAGGDMGDFLDTPENRASDWQRAEAMLQAPGQSRFAKSFQAPDFDQAMDRIGRSSPPPNPDRLSYVPGAAPDTVMDIDTGDIYQYGSKDNARYAGNITMPQYTELQRGSAAVMADLTRRGVLRPVTAKPLRSDYGWKSKTASQVPSTGDLSGIDVNNPTLEDIATNLSHESGTIWAQVDLAKKRAIGIGSVLAFAASAVAGPLVAGALTVPGQAAGLGAQAAGAGASAAAAGLGAVGGQYAGHGFDLQDIDWNQVVRASLIGGAAAGAGFGAGAAAQSLGVPAGPGITAISRGASQATSQGIGSVLPQPGGSITAYQPYPGISPERAQRNITRLGY